MGLFSFFTARREARQIALAAKEVATRSHAAVLDRVRRRAATMRVSEARGYVRSRALDIVHRELAAMHKGQIKVDPAIQTRIISQATDAVVSGVMAELKNQVENDMPIWEHKIYLESPTLYDGDGPIHQYRKWFKQFYGEPAPAPVRKVG